MTLSRILLIACIGCGGGSSSTIDAAADGQVADGAPDAALDGSDAPPDAALPGLQGAWTYVKATNTQSGDYFGWSLALSADGNTLAVGTPWEASSATGIGGNQADNTNEQSGAVYVYARTSSGWAPQAYVKASNSGMADKFGFAVALSADGNTLVAGAPNEASCASGINNGADNNDCGGAGAAYVFVRDGQGAWSEEAYFKASNNSSPTNGYGRMFGESLALSADGNTIAVAALGDASPDTGVGADSAHLGATLSGAVHVFTRSGGAWAQQAYVKSSNTGTGDLFGRGLALSANGNVMAVGASGERSAATGIGGSQLDDSKMEAGAAYVFARSGPQWSQQAYVKASNTDAMDLFGDVIALSGDGATLAISSRYEDSSATGIDGAQADNAESGSGAVYVFVHGTSGWSQQAYVKSTRTRSGETFGDALSVSADGNVLAVGAYNEYGAGTGITTPQPTNTAGSGAAYLFRRTGTTWFQHQYVKAPNAGENDLFGTHVALSTDGSVLAVTARLEASAAVGVGGDQNSDAAPMAGAAYVVE